MTKTLFSPNPTFYKLLEKNESMPFLRNYYCKNYDSCLIEAARQNLLLSCHNCSLKNDRTAYDGFSERLKAFLI
jgi:hypothetical protein